MSISSRLSLGVLLLVLTGAIPAYADPPSRVGRISDIEGSLSIHHANDNQWSAAGLNFPVIAGDSLWSGPSSRAEIQVGATEIRMDEQAEVDLIRLDENGAQIRIDQGVVNLYLAYVPAGGVSVLTAAGVTDLASAGNYHFDTGRPAPGAPASLVQIGVLSGDARLSAQRTTIELRTGQGALVGPDMSTLTLTPFAGTAFDSWALRRVQQEQAAAQASAAYVSPEMTGVQSLGNYGRWMTTPDYGAVWVPTSVADNWAPYRYGHWAYVSPWGWTWIDDSPWGFAPFHYGRWVEWEGHWAWCPGRMVEHPVYAPALVAFIGGGGGGVDLAISVGSGPGIGWVPLGPAEVYHPYFPVSETYIRNVNVTNVTNITTVNNVTNVTVNKFVNQQAVTVVPTSSFAAAQPVNNTMVQARPAQWAQTPVTNNLGHITPAALPQTASSPISLPPRIAPSQPTPAGAAGTGGGQGNGPIPAPAQSTTMPATPRQGPQTPSQIPPPSQIPSQIPSQPTAAAIPGQTPSSPQPQIQQRPQPPAAAGQPASPPAAVTAPAPAPAAASVPVPARQQPQSVVAPPEIPPGPRNAVVQPSPPQQQMQPPQTPIVPPAPQPVPRPAMPAPPAQTAPVQPAPQAAPPPAPRPQIQAPPPAPRPMETPRPVEAPRPVEMPRPVEIQRPVEMPRPQPQIQMAPQPHPQPAPQIQMAPQPHPQPQPQPERHDKEHKEHP